MQTDTDRSNTYVFYCLFSLSCFCFLLIQFKEYFLKVNKAVLKITTIIHWS